MWYGPYCSTATAELMWKETDVMKAVGFVSNVVLTNVTLPNVRIWCGAVPVYTFATGKQHFMCKRNQSNLLK